VIAGCVRRDRVRDRIGVFVLPGFVDDDHKDLFFSIEKAKAEDSSLKFLRDSKSIILFKRVNR
jgi:hypothetical protein